MDYWWRQKNVWKKEILYERWTKVNTGVNSYKNVWLQVIWLFSSSILINLKNDQKNILTISVSTKQVLLHDSLYILIEN